MPRNENKFLDLWTDYRLSFERMAYIHEHSLTWRITCNYDTQGLNYYVDFVRASTADLSLFTLSTEEGQCVPVQRIAITGYICKDCRAHMVQSEELPLHFYGKASIACGSINSPRTDKPFVVTVKLRRTTLETITVQILFINVPLPRHQQRKLGWGNRVDDIKCIAAFKRTYHSFCLGHTILFTMGRQPVTEKTFENTMIT